MTATVPETALDNSLPEALTSRDQWIIWEEKKVGGKLKKPPAFNFKAFTKYSSTSPRTWISYEEALEIDGNHIAFVLTEDDPIVLLDLDDETDLNEYPESLRLWIETEKPYVELSPSGNGLRIVAQIDQELKPQLGAYYGAYPNTFKGQVSIQKSYQTITHNKTRPNEKGLPALSLPDLRQWFSIPVIDQKIEDDDEYEAVNVQEEGDTVVRLSPVSFPNLKEVTQIMFQDLPLNQNVRVVKAYERMNNKTYAHYDYWLELGMMLYDYGDQTNQLPQALNLFIEWSLSDPNEGQKLDTSAYAAKWKSFRTEMARRLTCRTLFKLAKMVRFRWPFLQTRLIKGRTANTDKPDILEYDNFIYLLDYYNIQIRKSTLGQYGYYVDGDPDIIEKYMLPLIETDILVSEGHGPIYVEGLVQALFHLCSDNGFRKFTYGKCEGYAKSYIISHVNPKDYTNPFKTYIETPDQGEDSSKPYYTLDHLFSALTLKHWAVRNKTKYKEMFKLVLMQMMKHHFYEGPFDENNVMLILSGPEKSYKSSFLKGMIPPEFKSFIRENSLTIDRDGTVRDAFKLCSHSLLYLIDECEQFGVDMSNDATFKVFLTVDKPYIIDKFMVRETLTQRRALIVGTTNSENLRLGDNGSRRFAIVPVLKCNTEIFKKFDFHRFYRHLYYDFYLPEIEAFESGDSDKLPWVMTDLLQDFVNASNANVLAVSSLDQEVKELFDFKNYSVDNIPAHGVRSEKPGFMSTVEFIKYFKSQYPQQRVNTSAMDHTLKRVLGSASGSFGKEIHISRPKGVLADGKFHQGWDAKRKKYRYSKWFMPPLINIAFNSMDDQYCEN